jgi:hypothetical protein
MISGTSCHTFHGSPSHLLVGYRSDGPIITESGRNAASPPHSAVRLCLTGQVLSFPGGYASNTAAEAQSLLNNGLPERQSLSALGGGEAALPTTSMLMGLL